MSDTPFTGIRSWDERERLLRVVQPALIGLIDGTVSTLAPIFAAAYVGGLALRAAGRDRRRARRGDQHGPLGGAVGRRRADRPGDATVRGTITGAATFLGGGSLHALPFLIGDVHTALKIAYVVVVMVLRRSRLSHPKGLSNLGGLKHLTSTPGPAPGSAR